MATLHAGIPEGLPPANHALLAREGDAEDLAQKLMSLASQRDRWGEFGHRGREWVIRQFSLNDEIATYQRLFEEIATSPAADPARRATDALPSPAGGA